MSKKRKDLSKSEIRDFFPTSEDRDDALEEYGSHLGSFDNLFEEEDEDDDDNEDDD